MTRSDAKRLSRDRRPVPGVAAAAFAATLLAAVAVALPAVIAAPSQAAVTSGGAFAPPPKLPNGSASGAPSPEPSAGAIAILSAATSPRKSFYFGYRYPRLRFAISSTQPQNDLQVDVVNQLGEVVRSFFRNDVAPEATTNLRWDGTGADGRPVRNGRYSFQIRAQGAPVAARPATASTAAALGFAIYGYAFPVLGAHEYGLEQGRFGAARSGHTHQGQDVMAACGTPLVAARGGTVQYSGFQSAAGNYVVIDGKGTANDFMYAHLLEPSPLQTGDTVRTGQPIGLVGETGSASGCHLHFEIWTAPGWYEGGGPIDPLLELQRWDRYS